MNDEEREKYLLMNPEVLPRLIHEATEENKGLSNYQLARLVGVSEASVRKHRGGHFPRPAALKNYVRILGDRIDRHAQGDSPAPPPPSTRAIRLQTIRDACAVAGRALSDAEADLLDRLGVAFHTADDRPPTLTPAMIDNLLLLCRLEEQRLQETITATHENHRPRTHPDDRPKR